MLRLIAVKVGFLFITGGGFSMILSFVILLTDFGTDKKWCLIGGIVIYCPGSVLL